MAMLSYFVHIALVAVAVPILVYPTAAEDIRIPIDACRVDIAEIQSFGESTGSEWCAMRVKDGIFVNGVKAWHTPNEQTERKDLGTGYTTGLEVSFTDGKSTMIGTQDGEYYVEVEWDPAEVGVEWMTGMDIQEVPEMGIDMDKFLNRFEFVLTNGEYFCAGGMAWPKEHNPDYNNPEHNWCRKEKPADSREYIGGQLLGFSGALGTNGIEAITAYFLKSDSKNTEIHDVVISPSIEELNERSADDRGLTQKTLMVGHCLNELDSGNVTFTLSKDTQFTTTKKVTNEVSSAWHAGAEIGFEYTFGVPAVMNKKVTVKQDYFWERTEMNSEENAEGSSTTVKWGANVPVPPGKAVRIAGYAIEGKMDVTWTGKMTLTLQTGEKITFPTGGTMKDTFFSQSYTTIDEEDPEDARLAVLDGDGTFVDQQGNEASITPASERLGRKFIA